MEAINIRYKMMYKDNKITIISCRGKKPVKCMWFVFVVDKIIFIYDFSKFLTDIIKKSNKLFAFYAVSVVILLLLCIKANVCIKSDFVFFRQIILGQIVLE